MGKEYTLNGFAYTPQKVNGEGMIEQGILKVNNDGKSWSTFESFEFGNLINDPVTRTHQFKIALTTRYIRIQSKVISGGDTSAAIAELDFFE